MGELIICYAVFVDADAWVTVWPMIESEFADLHETHRLYIGRDPDGLRVITSHRLKAGGGDRDASGSVSFWPAQLVELDTRHVDTVRALTGLYNTAVEALKAQRGSLRCIRQGWRALTVRADD